MLLVFTLISGILISISANSWLGVWVGLEINLLSLIPMMSSTEDMTTTEASMKYFIVQAVASSILIFSVTLLPTLSNSGMTPSTMAQTFLNLPLLIKMGSAPFHWWFPSVMEGLQWDNCFILLTLQSVAPLMLISYTLTFNLMSNTIIMLSSIVGSLGGFNQVSLRKILTYSSINHLGWMIAAITLSKSTLTLYLAIYSITNLILTKMLKMTNTSHINQINATSRKNIMIKTPLMIVLLSLGGLPPFVGFIPKWLVIQSMVSNHQTMTISLLVMTSLITLHYYLRMTYTTFMISDTLSKWHSQSPPSSMMASNVIAIILGLLMIAPTMSIPY
uniref:NADH-ubiquinone oxidoreductase chain 2 n=1 Tax=Anaplecta calosoma TaxID=1554546 RepID=A0A2P1H9B7_9NEOP|nr:NADH dehydrogenase subunit 2 [Anaplecta calosoma]